MTLWNHWNLCSSMYTCFFSGKCFFYCQQSIRTPSHFFASQILASFHYHFAQSLNKMSSSVYSNIFLCSPDYFMAYSSPDLLNLDAAPLLYDAVHCNSSDLESTRNLWDCATEAAVSGQCNATKEAAAVACQALPHHTAPGEVSGMLPFHSA